MKKFAFRFISVVLALFMLFALCACNDKGADNDGNDGGIFDPIGDGQNNPDAGKTSEYKGVIITQVYGNGDNVDGSVERSYVQLYNCTDKDISLAGASLYFRGNKDMKYSELHFDADEKIAAKGYFLIAFATGNPVDKDTGAVVQGGPYIFKIEKFDKESQSPFDYLEEVTLNW